MSLFDVRPKVEKQPKYISTWMIGQHPKLSIDVAQKRLLPSSSKMPPGRPNNGSSVRRRPIIIGLRFFIGYTLGHDPLPLLLRY